MRHSGLGGGAAITVVGGRAGGVGAVGVSCVKERLTTGARTVRLIYERLNYPPAGIDKPARGSHDHT